ncbi:hypothetical protein PUNSTDRAFT_123392 [Punctularia strigosozonata HHB-11173 SS5]|uniref:uncharacterized protein n=1 Tax=Punctularia strigosozonata (strain HHB-11173) TaxID=741275 RepID=UPI0004417BF2|nr:uncharacterized protein PUNSTDRAFT_123392 [Punctularia strigosozonata HHB-11173 SS5]EIN13292.1 hypothetical protein PUNSTDRAFT_123392 [Punctularia strigosozonata HHB-11173 SS5]
MFGFIDIILTFIVIFFKPLFYLLTCTEVDEEALTSAFVAINFPAYFRVLSTGGTKCNNASTAKCTDRAGETIMDYPTMAQLTLNFVDAFECPSMVELRFNFEDVYARPSMALLKFNFEDIYARPSTTEFKLNFEDIYDPAPRSCPRQRSNSAPARLSTDAAPAAPLPMTSASLEKPEVTTVVTSTSTAADVIARVPRIRAHRTFLLDEPL